MTMSGRLDQIEQLLRPQLGSALLACCPDLIYTVNAQLVRFMRTDDTLAALWRKIDSALFNAVYTGTQRSMVVLLDDGVTRIRVTSDQLRDLSDRLLALAYARLDVSPTLQSALFDLSREGSFAAMRELIARFPLDAFDREWITQVLTENNQLK